MARAPKTQTPKPSESTAIVNWDQTLAEQAEIAAGMEKNTGGGQFFSMKGGQLSFNDNPVPGNQMAVVIVDSVLENVFYEGDYDPTTPTSPTCFAFARDESDLAPHEVVTAADQAQHDTCDGCPMNEWASAAKGKGKACRNTRRLAMVAAGTFDNGRFKPIEDPAHYESASFGYMKLPVTSVKGYASFVKQIAGALRRPPHGIFTKVTVAPDAKTQFKVVFEPISVVPNSLLPALMKRNKESQATIMFPYTLSDPEAEAPPAKPAPRGKAPPKAAAKPASRAAKYR